MTAMLLNQTLLLLLTRHERGTVVHRKPVQAGAFPAVQQFSTITGLRDSFAVLGVQWPRQRSDVVHSRSGLLKSEVDVSIWRRPEVDKPALLAQCRAAYRRLAKDFHPDRGAAADQWYRLSTAWKRIRTRFYKHGYSV